MPTQPLPVPMLPAAEPAEQALSDMVLLRFLPRPFVEFLDRKLGALIDLNGGFAHWGIEVKRGRPGGFVASETFKEDAWTEDKAS